MSWVYGRRVARIGAVGQLELRLESASEVDRVRNAMGSEARTALQTQMAEAIAAVAAAGTEDVEVVEVVDNG